MDPETQSALSINRRGEVAPLAGWPFGLETMHLRGYTMRGAEIDPLGLATSSFSSMSSSDFDTESSMSFFADKSVTLGSLIGLNSDRSTRYVSNIVHPVDHMGTVARRPRSYQRVRSWKSLTGCMHFTSRLQSSALYLAQLLKAEKRDGEEKVYMNAINDETEGGLSAGTNPPHLDCNRNQPRGVISERMASLDLEIIEEGPPAEILQKEYGNNREESQGLCMPFVSNILPKLNPSRG